MEKQGGSPASDSGKDGSNSEPPTKKLKGEEHDSQMNRTEDSDSAGASISAVYQGVPGSSLDLSAQAFAQLAHNSGGSRSLSPRPFRAVEQQHPVPPQADANTSERGHAPASSQPSVPEMTSITYQQLLMHHAQQQMQQAAAAHHQQQQQLVQQQTGSASNSNGVSPHLVQAHHAMWPHITLGNSAQLHHSLNLNFLGQPNPSSSYNHQHQQESTNSISCATNGNHTTKNPKGNELTSQELQQLAASEDAHDGRGLGMMPRIFDTHSAALFARQMQFVQQAQQQQQQQQQHQHTQQQQQQHTQQQQKTTNTANSNGTHSDSDSQLSRPRPQQLLFMSCDNESLSEYQCLVRKQIELFQALKTDVESNAQGRNRPIVLGQVGIRCAHCVMLPPKHRARGAVYYPAKLHGLYQAAQNMASSHLCVHCQHVPVPIREELLKLRDRKSSAGGGKKYWADGVRVLGVFEDEKGLRFERSK